MTHPLRTYLRREGLSYNAFAKLLGGKTASAHVDGWVSGKWRPRLATAKKIEKVTGGAVTAAQMLGVS